MISTITDSVMAGMTVTVEGHRDILGLWIGDGGEGAKYWLQVLTEIKNRGAADVPMLVCDGLTGLPDAVNTVWPATIVQPVSFTSTLTKSDRVPPFAIQTPPAA
ncbi:transposase [Streptomyces sp. NPDC051987]|uniref:transposase n=1 Tax=Streptomyces sp. NPDC051987 TaxID=3155808 RepID=UPI00343D8926